MAFLIRSNEIDLIQLVRDLDESPDPSMSKIVLRDLIISSKYYKEEEAKELLEVITAERLETEQKEKLEQQEQLSIEKLRLEIDLSRNANQCATQNNGQISRVKSLDEIVKMVRLLTGKVPNKSDGYFRLVLAVKCLLVYVPIGLATGGQVNVVNQQVLCALAEVLVEDVLLPPEVLDMLGGAQSEENSLAQSSQDLKVDSGNIDETEVSSVGTLGSKDEEVTAEMDKGSMVADSFRFKQECCAESALTWKHAKEGKGNYYEKIEDRSPITPVARPELPFQVVNMDLIGPIDPPSSKGHKYILCLVDQHAIGGGKHGPDEDKILATKRLIRPTTKKEVHCNASDYGVGCCLTQQDTEGIYRPIAFATQKFNATQKNWASIEKEAWAVLKGLNKFDKGIYGAKVEIISDHNPLKYLNQTTPKSPKLTRWTLALQRWNHSITHSPGVVHVLRLKKMRPDCHQQKGTQIEDFIYESLRCSSGIPKAKLHPSALK
ncbi:RT_RNaseH domain-containing protein [Trichonephila clavipes]|nr:RT_RNaseH domain-containing protein [Trichonephila clavipes]